MKVVEEKCRSNKSMSETGETKSQSDTENKQFDYRPN